MRKPPITAHEPTPEQAEAQERLELIGTLREHIDAKQFPSFVRSVDRASRCGHEVIVSMHSFGYDGDLLYACLAYAYFKEVRVAIEPQPFRGVRRNRPVAKHALPGNPQPPSGHAPTAATQAA